MSYIVKKGNQEPQNWRKEFRTFEDLQVCQVAREFRKKMYRVTRRLPDFEKFGLRDRKVDTEAGIREVDVSSTDDAHILALLDEALSSATI
jgi:hypothetical protein